MQNVVGLFESGDAFLVSSLRSNSMTTITIKESRAREVALILAGSLLASSTVFSAEPPPEAQVTIRAERPTAKVVGYTNHGVPIEQYEISYHVTFSDLDLATPVGAQALKARVYKAADSLCKDLDKLYPLTEPDGKCVQKAQDGAMSQVNSAISVAQAQTKTKAR
jgi:UrcA family protein